MPSETSLPLTPTTSNLAGTSTQSLPTFLEHVHELRRRLFWVVAVVLVVSAVSYSFLNDIISVLTAPLGDKQLYYLTPAGGLTFTFKLCTFVGFVAGVPVLMYHIYRFLEPLMGSRRKSAFFYVGLSTMFAAAGVAFAYFVSLPAALHFLTNFNLGNIQAMLTVDSYLSFVVTYLLGAALLFQIPLLLIIINTMTPLKPSRLMKLQKFVIVGAFILAAIISPTPDIMNQAFLAIPVIAMYQVGVLLVWAQNAASARKARRESRQTQHSATVSTHHRPTEVPTEVLDEMSQSASAPAAFAQSPAAQQEQVSVAPSTKVFTPPVQSIVRRPQRIMMDIAPRRSSSRPAVRPVQQMVRPRSVAASSPARPHPSLQVPARTIDGFTRYTPAISAGPS